MKIIDQVLALPEASRQRLWIKHATGTSPGVVRPVLPLRWVSLLSKMQLEVTCYKNEDSPKKMVYNIKNMLRVSLTQRDAQGDE